FAAPSPSHTYTLSLHDALPIFPFGDPLPERRGVARQPDIIATAAERLAQDGADGAVVIGYKNRRSAHHATVSSGRLAVGAIGRQTRKIVRRGWLSNSMMPPWSPTILATRARPSPVPL